MSPQIERDFPIGHPAAVDTVIGSPDHLAWIEQHKFSENVRDFPPGHPKAVDTAGNLNALPVRAGVDPHNPHLEEFTGRTPERAAAVREWNKEEAAGAHESPVMPVIDAAVLNAALAEERARLHVDALTMEETQAVMSSLQHLALALPAPATSGQQLPMRLNMDEVRAREAAGTMPLEWYPHTGKPWYGPPS